MKKLFLVESRKTKKLLYELQHMSVMMIAYPQKAA